MPPHEAAGARERVSSRTTKMTATRPNAERRAPATEINYGHGVRLRQRLRLANVCAFTAEIRRGACMNLSNKTGRRPRCGRPFEHRLGHRRSLPAVRGEGLHRLSAEVLRARAPAAARASERRGRPLRRHERRGDERLLRPLPEHAHRHARALPRLRPAGRLHVQAVRGSRRSLRADARRSRRTRCCAWRASPSPTCASGRAS